MPKVSEIMTQMTSKLKLLNDLVLNSLKIHNFPFGCVSFEKQVIFYILSLNFYIINDKIGVCFVHKFYFISTKKKANRKVSCHSRLSYVCCTKSSIRSKYYETKCCMRTDFLTLCSNSGSNCIFNVASKINH